jgi:hypothetical protein
MSPSNRDVYEPLVVELLAYIYRAVDWRKAAGSKYRWDVWNHRIRAAATRGTLGAFASRLANYFGLQSLPPETIEVLEELRPYEAEALDLIYTEHVPIAMAAVVAATGRRKPREESHDGPGLFTD